MAYYTMEKVLYLADSKGVFNLDIDEYTGRSQTTLHELVTKAVKKGWLTELATDDSDAYFDITKKGKKKLIKLQIEWRESRGKDVSDLKAKLESL